MNELPRIARALNMIFLLFILLAVVALLLFNKPDIFENRDDQVVAVQKPRLWRAPDPSTILKNEKGELVQYGRDLIVRTSYYLGPHGTVANISNGMNCQNCHLEAGTKPFGNNYGSVASMYPKFRARSGSIESIEKRVNDCLERSLNGSALDSLSHEMRAIVAYMNWLGQNVPKGKPATGSGLVSLPWMERQADTVAGKKIFLTTCRVCHGSSGEGQRIAVNGDFINPPSWGEHSYNTGAGLYRISNLARYVYANMPNGATHEKPILTQEEAWDVAAYIISQPRPQKDFHHDWPKLEIKPVDHPFGPYIDKFSETQHKYGPFPPIESSRK